MKDYFKLIRIKHVVKNLIIFFPIFFSLNFFDVDLLLKEVGGFCAFSFAAFSIYIFNDIFDKEEDSKHPTKQNRPIASGRVSIQKAIMFLVVNLIICLLFLLLIKATFGACFLILLYLLLNIFYSFRGKKIPIMDVTILSLGYPIRVLFGGMVTDIEISSLLFLTVFCLSLYFSLGKRYGEMSKNSSETREVLRSYSGSYLSHFMFLCMGLGIVFYSMWTIENSHSLLIYSVPFVLIICMKYHMLIEKTDGDPVNSFFSDKHLIILVALYVAFVSAILYL